MWIDHILQIVFFVQATRIMCRPIISRGTIKVIVDPSFYRRGVIHWAIEMVWVAGNEVCRCGSIFTRASHMLNQLTVYTSSLPVNQTSSFRITNQPVVDVTLDQYLSAKLSPIREVYGVVVCFMQWWSCWDRHVHCSIYWPIWSGSDSVWIICEIVVIRKGITPR